MTDAAKRARAEYMKEWRSKNPEKFKEQRKHYWEKKAMLAAEAEGRTISAEDMEDAARKARSAYTKEWRHANPEKFRAQRERYWEKKAARAAEDAERDGDGE